MTDKERLLALLDDFGLAPTPVLTEPNDVILRAGHGGVEGYVGFECVFEFDADGKFHHVRVWE